MNACVYVYKHLCECASVEDAHVGSVTSAPHLGIAGVVALIDRVAVACCALTRPRALRLAVAVHSACWLVGWWCVLDEREEFFTLGRAV